MKIRGLLSRMNRAPSAIVTGAGSGIGRATAIALARSGYHLSIVGRRIDALHETARACGHAVKVRCVACDVAVVEQIDSLIQSHADSFAGLDVLINNAGVGEVRPLSSVAADDITRAMMTNACSAGWAISKAWPIWVKQNSGCIINVASMAVFDPFPGFFGYAASKAALAMMAVSASKEGATHGIRAFAVCPGAVETEMLRASFSEEVIPADQCLKPEDVAAVIMECIMGTRDADNGRAIPVVSAAAQSWLDAHRTSPGMWLR